MWYLKKEMSESEDPILLKNVQEWIKGMAYVISLNKIFFSSQGKRELQHFKIGACGLNLWWISLDILKSVCLHKSYTKK